MIKPKVGICTCIMPGYNLHEEDSVVYQKELAGAVKKLGFVPVIAGKFITEPEIAKETATLFSRENIDLFILNVGTFTDDFRVLPLLTGIDIPFIVWAHDYNAFNISITGSQNINPNLYDLGLEYRYIYGRFDDDTALSELYKFSRACAIKNRLKNINIGYIGGHPKIMTSLTADEIMIKKTFGITLYNYGNEELLSESEKISTEESQKIWDEIKNKAGKVDAGYGPGIMTSSIHGAILKLVRENSLDAVSINCFPQLKGKVCIPVALLNDLGIPSACEGDLDSTILMYILYQLSGRAVSNGDQLKIYNLDKPENSMMFSHCGAGALSLAADKREIEIHADYETGQGLAVYFPERIPGEVTVANMHGSREGYRMFITRGNVLDTNLMKDYEGTPMNIRFGFNIREMLKEIAYGGFGHHWNIGYGNHVEELVELCTMLEIDYTLME
jgi:L-fucose isomerase-like protein